VGVVVMAVGVAVDAAVRGTPGSGLSTAFLVGCLVIALRTRVRHLAAALVTTPLLYAVGVAAVIRLSGNVSGTRQLALDVATSLALLAPVLFGATGLAVVIALARAAEHLAAARRR